MYGVLRQSRCCTCAGAARGPPVQSPATGRPPSGPYLAQPRNAMYMCIKLNHGWQLNHFLSSVKGIANNVWLLISTWNGPCAVRVDCKLNTELTMTLIIIYGQCHIKSLICAWHCACMIYKPTVTMSWHCTCARRHTLLIQWCHAYNVMYSILHVLFTVSVTRLTSYMT